MVTKKVFGFIEKAIETGKEYLLGTRIWVLMLKFVRAIFMLLMALLIFFGVFSLVKNSFLTVN